MTPDHFSSVTKPTINKTIAIDYSEFAAMIKMMPCSNTDKIHWVIDIGNYFLSKDLNFNTNRFFTDCGVKITTEPIKPNHRKSEFYEND